MANVKITELTELAAVDLADGDVFPIVDVGADTTKKVTVASIKTISDSNDFVTYTQLNANIDVVSGNVDAVEANVASIVDTGGHTVTFSGNVIPSADGVYDLGSASAKWKDLHLTGSSIKLGGITISDLGNEGISITGASGEQANVVTPQLGGAANVSANIATLEANVASTDTRLGANITLLTAEDTALQARIAANTLVAASNDFITFTRLQANIDLVQDNVATVSVGTASDTETRLNANLDVVQDNVAAISVTLGIRGDGGTNDDVTVGTEELVFLGDTGITTTVSSNTVTIDLDDTAVTAGLYGGVSGGVTNVAAVTIDATGRITNAANISVVTNLDTLQDNINVLDGNADAIAVDVTALEARRAANVTLSDAEDTALQSRLTTNVAITTAVEARRVANIAGAISTVLTSDLTASRALSSDGSGKIAVATTTLAELNHVSGVTAAVQTQLDAVEARRAANNITTTFTDDVIVTGNLTINGDTTTINTTNMDVDDTLIMLANGTTGSPANDIGILFNRGAQGNAAFFYDESAKTFKLSDTKDPKSNTSLSPVTASNLSVGIVDAATVKFDGTSVQDAISANVTTLTNEDTALQSRLATNVTAFTNEDTALQARITANATITTAVEARRVANIAGAVSTITTGDLTASRALASDGSGKVAVSAVTATELGYLDGVSSAIQTQLDAKSTTANAAQLATGIASAGGGSMSDFSFEDGDGTSVEMTDNQRVKFIEGGGVDINFTDVSPGSVADPYDLTFTVASSVIAGDGLTGGGVLSADRTLTVGAGTGVTVNADDIAIGQDVATSASPTFAGLTVTTFDLGALS